eukprot:758080-Hanusia_phi.AAC.3
MGEAPHRPARAMQEEEEEGDGRTRRLHTVHGRSLFPSGLAAIDQNDLAVAAVAAAAPSAAVAEAVVVVVVVVAAAAAEAVIIVVVVGIGGGGVVAPAPAVASAAAAAVGDDAAAAVENDDDNVQGKHTDSVRLSGRLVTEATRMTSAEVSTILCSRQYAQVQEATPEP